MDTLCISSSTFAASLHFSYRVNINELADCYANIALHKQAERIKSSEPLHIVDSFVLKSNAKEVDQLSFWADFDHHH